MSNDPSGRFACPRCGKAFAWKDALAGKQVRCKCGNVFVATRDLVVAPLTQRKPEPERPEPETFDLWADPAPTPPTPPSRPVGRTPTSAAVVAPGTTVRGSDVPAQPPVPEKPTAFSAYPGRKRAKVQQEESPTDESPAKAVYIPIALAVTGLIGWVVLGAVYPLPNQSPAKTLTTGAVTIVGNAVILLVALFVSAGLLGVNFGSPKAVALKLLGMSLFVSAAFLLCVRIDYKQVNNGAIIGLHAIVFLYWVFFASLFDLEVQESLTTVAIVGLLQAMTMCVVLKM